MMMIGEDRVERLDMLSFIEALTEDDGDVATSFDRHRCPGRLTVKPARYDPALSCKTSPRTISATMSRSNFAGSSTSSIPASRSACRLTVSLFSARARLSRLFPKWPLP